MVVLNETTASIIQIRNLLIIFKSVCGTCLQNIFEVQLNRTLDTIQDHKKHSFRKGAALQTELKRAMHIEESTISILLIE